MLFLSTPSAGRATHILFGHVIFNNISIHALRGEGDSLLVHPVYCIGKFLSTPSAGRATVVAQITPLTQLDISIHALRGEGDVHSGGYGHTGKQFLSTPSAGRATLGVRPRLMMDYIFLSTPSAGRATHKNGHFRALSQLFLSTPSAGRATVLSRLAIRNPQNFYPRPPRGGRPPEGNGARLMKAISIHALRGEGDACMTFFHARGATFLSTPSAGRATADESAH